VDVEKLRDSLWRPTVALPQLFAGSQALEAPGALAGWTGSVQRLAVVSSLTADFIAKAVACAVFREGIFPQLYTGLYGAYVQEVLDHSSGLHAFNPDAVVLALDWRDVFSELPIGAPDADAAAAVASKSDRILALIAQLERRGYTIYAHTVAPPAPSYRGLAERTAAASPQRQVSAANERLFAHTQGRVHWIDVEALAQRTGLERWSPERLYLNGRLPFDPRFLPAYMRLFGGAWRAANARAKKVLAIDLDNTLWGGVVGDDGVENIALGPDSPAGEAYARFGAYVKALGERGVALAVCSKNDPQVAASAFAHPHAALRVEDFAAFECSWDDKVTGLRRIAAALNLGIDSFVFADDNPAECALVRAELPEVGVVELAGDPAGFVDALEAERWFDAERYTSEDLQRGRSYAARRLVEAERAGAVNMEAFLASLEMQGELFQAAEADLARIAQLEQKTNQFNLTTRRYDDAAVRAFAARGDAVVLGFRLRDRHADHGLVSSLIAIREGETLRVDSWLMSCRVFSRTAERFVMAGLLELARERGARTIIGEYLPTAKNGVVARLYADLGFTARDGEGCRWELDVAAAPVYETPIAGAQSVDAAR